jgi:hypothetical protein
MRSIPAGAKGSFALRVETKQLANRFEDAKPDRIRPPDRKNIDLDQCDRSPFPVRSRSRSRGLGPPASRCPGQVHLTLF